MKEKGLSQEGLKTIACLTMLIDHIGAALLPSVMGLRIIGRVAFPIFCFLLAEGVCHTRNSRKYGLRLALGALLSEIPFDLALFGGITLGHQSVMVTLLLGFLALEAIRALERKGRTGLSLAGQVLALWGAIAAADWLNTDYGGAGVLLIALFYFTRQLPRKRLIQALGLTAWVYVFYPGRITLLGLSFPIELPALGAMVPLCLYSGRKDTYGKGLQWAFYLFYPAHLSLLYLIRWILG